MKEKKDLIIYIVMVAILFGGGVGLGYYIWGMDKQKKPDYKSYLKETIQYLGKIEEQNVMLNKETKSLKNDIGLLSKKASEKQQELDKLSKSLKATIATLEKKNAELGSVMNEKMILAEEKVSLEKRVKEINDELNAVRQKTEEIKKVTGDEKRKEISTQENEQIQEQVKSTKEEVGEEKTKIIDSERGHEENKTLLREQKQAE